VSSTAHDAPGGPPPGGPPRVVSLDEIERVLPRLDLLPLLEAGFVAYSHDEVVVGPVGELLFARPRGEVHLKYGYVRDDDVYVIKIASGFYDNPALGLPSSSGLVLVFSQVTGELLALLDDHGRLTDERTAAAGALAAKWLAPQRVERIAILGSGTQARRQLAWLARVHACRRAVVWGRQAARAEAFARDARALGFEVETAKTAGQAVRDAQIVVTTTPATEALFDPDDVRPGTHITAVGSDTADKRELPAGLLARAELVIADSRAQCRERGEIAWGLRSGEISEARVVELGELLAGEHPGRPSGEAVTVADLTGVAVQDIQIAKAVLSALDGASGGDPD
jgi:ornithine cyclodeaminase